MELLRRLTNTIAPSGNEEDVRELICSEISEYVDEIDVDVLGNIIAHKKGNGKKLMLAAHADEIGIIVTYIEDNGFIRFHNIGGVIANYSISNRVQFKNGTIGVVFYEQNIEKKDIKLDNMYLDIGAKSAEEAQKKVQIGDVAGFMGEYIQTDDVVISKSLDDRVGCYILIEAIKNAKNSPNDVYAVFTVQEELGIRGATTSAYKIEPDMGIAIDVTDTGDTPGATPMAVKLGEGVAIKVKDNRIIAHQKVKNLMIETAKSNDIPYQMEVLTRGGTDAGAIHITKSGVPSGTLSVPTRYIHSSSEMVAISDIKACIKFLSAIIETKID